MGGRLREAGAAAVWRRGPRLGQGGEEKRPVSEQDSLPGCDSTQQSENDSGDQEADGLSQMVREEILMYICMLENILFNRGESISMEER